MTHTADLIRNRLAALQPSELHIVDDSSAHAGHAGAASGGGHFQLTIVSEQFAGQSPLARHRLVYAALADLMHKQIHALQIEALTPDQF